MLSVNNFCLYYHGSAQQNTLFTVSSSSGHLSIITHTDVSCLFSQCIWVIITVPNTNKYSRNQRPLFLESGSRRHGLRAYAFEVGQSRTGLPDCQKGYKIHYAPVPQDRTGSGGVWTWNKPNWLQQSSVWVCMLGPRKEDSCSVGVGTQPHIAPAFTVWPHSGGKLYLCVCNREHNGVLVGPCVWIVCYSEQCVLYFGNSTYISFSLDFGCSFLSWCDSPRIWPTKGWRNLIASHAPAVCVSIILNRTWWLG